MLKNKPFWIKIKNRLKSQTLEIILTIHFQRLKNILNPVPDLALQ